MLYVRIHPLFAEGSIIEMYECTWNVVFTQAAAGSLSNERDNVRNVLPGSIHYLRNMERYYISPFELDKRYRVRPVLPDMICAVCIH